MQDSSKNLLQAAHSQSIQDGVPVVESKTLEVEDRWNRLEMEYPKQMEAAVSLRDSFVHYEELREPIVSSLDKFDEAVKLKIMHGTDLNKLNDEVQRIEV